MSSGEIDSPTTLIIPLHKGYIVMSNQRRMSIFLSIAMWASNHNVDKEQVNPKLFNLSTIKGCLTRKATELLQSKNITGVMDCLDSQDGMAFIVDNLNPLITYGLYEEALFNAYIGTKTNFNAWNLRDLKLLFNLADKNILYGLGDEVSEKYPITVYRGICGDGDAYRPRGLSWTTNLETAKWFAKFPQQRYEKKFNNVHVYKTKVSEKKTYFFTNDRDEREFVCDITPKHKIELIWSDE